ncbi:MAG TPA: hypothetical protein VMH26_19610 [Burkholderiales bacterium]|nr:hypothetical protein [Burkholderiales bacterium]
MKSVNLSRLWYIFPPDDQELRPGEFERKVTSYINYLPRDQQIAVLDFLMVQYAAFQKQLEVLRARAVVSPPEHFQRAERLSHHLETLRVCRQSLHPN